MMRARLLVPLARPWRPTITRYSTASALGSRFRKSEPLRPELKFEYEDIPEIPVPREPTVHLKEQKGHVSDSDIDALFDSLMNKATKTETEAVPKLQQQTGEQTSQEATAQTEAHKETQTPTAAKTSHARDVSEYLERSKLTPHVTKQVIRAMEGSPTQLQLATPASLHISTTPFQHDLWTHVISKIDPSRFKIADFNSLMTTIPLDIRAQYLPQIEGWIADRKLAPSAITYGQVMMGYAEAGEVEKVEDRYRELIKAGMLPTVHTYAHRLKACDKVGDLNLAMDIYEDLKLAQELYGIRPNQVIFTTLISTSLRNHKVELASQIFEYMKYCSNETQPTAHTYNSLITASAVRSNTDRALDLFEDMKVKCVGLKGHPATPNVRTYQSLILACLRQDKYHYKAWELLLELREMHSESFYSRHTLVVVFQAAAVTGDLAFIRSLYKQLCMSPQTYPDAILTQLLMQAYARYDTRDPSPASAPLRATWGRLYGGNAQEMLRGFLFPDLEGMAQLAESHPGMLPPFMPTTTIESLSFSRKSIIAESRAVFQFLKANKPHLLDDIAAADYLKAGARHRDFDEFKRRYDEVSAPASGEASVASPATNKTYSARQRKPQRYDVESSSFQKAARTDSHFFTALSAVQSDCLADSHETDPNLEHPLRQLTTAEVNDRLDFTQAAWIERGQWRKTAAFANKYKSEALQLAADYNFALKIINALASLKLLGDAAKILSSTPATFNWKKKDLAFFHHIAVAFYNEEALAEIEKAVNRSTSLDEAIRNPDPETNPEFDIFNL